MNKRCYKCEQTKHIDCFRKNVRCKDGYRNICVACENIQKKAYYFRTRVKIRVKKVQKNETIDHKYVEKMAKLAEKDPHWFMVEPYKSMTDEQVWKALKQGWLKNKPVYNLQKKTRPFMPVRQFTLSGAYLATYNHPIDAIEALDRRNHQGIVKVCNNRWTQSLGFIWKWAKDGNIKDEIRETESRNQEKTTQSRSARRRLAP